MEVGDQHIGQLLSKAPADENGNWPGLPVCEVMEEVASDQIGRGFSIGLYHARGVQLRERDGAQEHGLAVTYRRRANKLEFGYPHVSAILKRIADEYEAEANWWDDEAEIDRRRES